MLTKSALNWLAKEWIKKSKGNKAWTDASVRPIYRMMDTSSKRVANPSELVQKLKEKVSDIPAAIGEHGSLYGNILHNAERTLDALKDDGLRNEYARMFLRNVMKSKGTIDELAVRQFVKENPKMVQQLLVKNEAIPAGLSVRDTAKRLSEMYPNGMIKGPVAYERGLMKRNQELLDKIKKERGVNIIENDEVMEYAGPGVTLINDKGGPTIYLRGTKRQSPITVPHEMGEAAEMHELFNREMPGLGKGWRYFMYPTIKKDMKTWNDMSITGKSITEGKPVLEFPGVLGLHAGPFPLKVERDVLKKIPRYIDLIQNEIGFVRNIRDYTNEYKLIDNIKKLREEAIRVIDNDRKYIVEAIPVR